MPQRELLLEFLTLQLTGCTVSAVDTELYEFVKIYCTWSSYLGAGETNPTRNHEVVGLMPGLPQWVKDLALP